MGEESYRNARDKVLKEIDPTAPPDESINKISKIAEEHNVEDRTEDLIGEFLEEHNINPDDPPPIFILRSGHQITAEGRDEEIVEQLTNATLGESLRSVRESAEDDWSEILHHLDQEIREEVDHVAETAHKFTIRSLFKFLLYEWIKEKQDTLFDEVFPQLRADPEKISETVEDTKSGMVLLLGKDTEEGLERLREVENIMERYNRNCVLLKDQPEHLSQGFKNKLLMYATLARYIIVEHTFASGHLFELPYIDDLESVIIVLQEEGKGASKVADRMIKEDDLIGLFHYNPGDLEQTLEEAVEWAEDKVEENKQLNIESYEWLE